MDIKAFAPNGQEIVSTLEVLHGTCGVTFERKPDGTVEVDFDGSGTDVDWDSQATVTREGKRVFLDESGNEWTEDQITYRDDADEEEK